jgi:DNA primase
MTLYPGFAKLYHEALPGHIRRYLNARGIPDPVIERAQLGWNGNRITIPVYERDDRLVLYKLGKAPAGPTDSPKMLYDPPGVTAELYGWDTIRRNPSFIVVCEGEYDRLVLEARGFPAVTGTGGAGVFKAEWAQEISKVPTVYLCFDNDAAGRAGAERVARLIPKAKVIT